MASSNPAPQVDTEASFRAEVNEGFQQDIAAVSNREDQLALLTSIQSFSFKFIKDASVNPGEESKAAIEGLEALWSMFIEAAKVIDKDDPLQDKLIYLLLWTKAFDMDHRVIHNRFANSTIWTPLEHGTRSEFVETLQSALKKVETTEQRCNLAAFAAKAFAIGICSPQLGNTVMWFLFEALETDNEAKSIDLLPAAVALVDHCRHKLLSLSALDADMVVKSKFNIERWLRWRGKFQELAHSKDPLVAKLAHKGFTNMINCGRDLDYEVPGEAKFALKLQTAMGEALVKSGKESLSGDDIDIDVDWVN